MKPIVIKFSLGDLHQMYEAVQCVVKYRKWSVIPKTWWVIRENQRRGMWEPFSMGRYIYMWRMKKYLAHYPRRTVHPGKWRH